MADVLRNSLMADVTILEATLTKEQITALAPAYVAYLNQYEDLGLTVDSLGIRIAGKALKELLKYAAKLPLFSFAAGMFVDDKLYVLINYNTPQGHVSLAFKVRVG
jgi:hypothetical protein